MTPTDPVTEYAYWTSPGEQFTVTYSLAVFHDIDFQVSEGFRRIPHGGVETGGLLFGRLEQSAGKLSVQVEAFRPIDCEHASGPSFNLSERDLAMLREQLALSKLDPELHGLEVLGWFVAHTRSPLEMNDREAALFAQLFPGPGRMLMLVKPERFQATRFGFILRGLDGSVAPDAAANAIILPLPGRAGRAAQGPAASIPAPAQSMPPASAQPAAPPKPLPAVPRAPVLPTRPAPAAESPASDSGTFTRAFWRQFAPPAAVKQEPVVWIQEPPAVLPSETTNEPVREGQQRITRPMRRERKPPSALRMAALLLLAAGLGCGVGYLAYLQLPAATIALRVQPEAATPFAGGTQEVMISWPAEETRDAIFASLRVDDGEPIPLSKEQKETGRAMIPVRSDNVKIEVTAQRRWRDSRGIVRYVRAKPVTP